MKTKKHDTRALPLSGSREHEVRSEGEVQREIESFLSAVKSYPDRFAREPYLSFQQHLCSIVTGAHPPGTDE